MISEDILMRGVSDESVIEAMRRVPRERFVPSASRFAAYADAPLPIACGQTISQPYIVALMTSMLALGPWSRVLEIGTGSGYQAAVLAQISSHVYTLEIIPELLENARTVFSQLGYGNISAKSADGADGWPEQAPFDGIIVTAAAPQVPEALKCQLRPGGRLVLPLGEPNDVQQLITIRRDDKDAFSREDGILVRFVPMTGKCR